MANKIKNHSSNYNYFFVRPIAKKNVHETARKLIGIAGIREVVITEGDYGFIVKADPLYGKGNDSLDREIIKIVGGSSSKAVCYCEYHKE